MNFFQSINACFSKYFVFKGRASRSEFWYFWLLNFFITLTILISSANSLPTLGLGALFIWVIMIIPGLAVGCRRLHDTGKSGWWQLVAFIPFGPLILLFLWSRRGDDFENGFGHSPTEQGIEGVFQ